MGGMIYNSEASSQQPPFPTSSTSEKLSDLKQEGAGLAKQNTLPRPCPKAILRVQGGESQVASLNFLQDMKKRGAFPKDAIFS